MIVIFGIKGSRSVLATLMLVCSVCQNPAAHRIEKITNTVTLFFVSVFPVGSKYSMQCAMCAAQTDLSASEAQRLVDSSPRCQTSPGRQRELG